MTLKEPWAPAVATLFSYGTAPQYVLPAHVLEKEPNLEQSAFAAHPVGNGPYRFVSWARGDHLVYEANPAYWRGAPEAARLDIRIVPDPASNFTLLQSGGLDWNLHLARAARVARQAGAARVSHRPARADRGHRDQHDASAARRRARAARDRGVDRPREHLDKITFGRYPVVDTAQPLGSWARDPAVHVPAYDPAAADRLLDAAGWKRGADGMRAKDGKQLALTYVQFPE